MNKFVSALIVLLVASTSAADYNKMTVDPESNFYRQRTQVCEHFSISDKAIEIDDGVQAYYIDGQMVLKPSVLLVRRKNVPAWHCGERAWKIDDDISKSVALGVNRPVE